MFPTVVIVLLAAATAAHGSLRSDLEEGRYLKALADAEARLAKHPEDALAWAGKAHAQSALMRFPEALAAADRAIALNANLADAYLARALARGGLAVQQRNFGSLRKASGALEDLQKATQLDPDNAMAWTSLGLAYQQLPGLLGGSTRKALACAEALRRLRPARADALQGMILSLDKRWKDAEPCFQRALAQAPGDPQVVGAFLEALCSRETRGTLGERAQKARALQEARRLLPGVRTRAKGVEAVCDALLDADQPAEAWKAAEDALPHVEAPTVLKLQLGKIGARAMVQPQAALRHLDELLQGPIEGGTGGRPAAFWRKGQILQQLGRKAEAQEAARAALALDPKHPGALSLTKNLASGN